MKTSASGRALIEQREERRLAAYRDSRGIWTIGVGHTGRMAPPLVSAGMTINETECDAYLAADLAPVEAVINTVRVPISQNEFDALTSLGFNIGVAGLRSSTVLRKLNLGDIAGAAAAIMLWDKPAVLIKRRTDERAQFLSADEPTESDPAPSKTVAANRAQILAVRAHAAKSTARTTQTAGGAVALVGAGVAATASHMSYAHVALWIAGLVVLGVVIDGLVAWWHHAKASTLATNAAKQTVVAAAPAPSNNAPEKIPLAAIQVPPPPSAASRPAILK